jgi:hypothetical protein
MALGGVLGGQDDVLALESHYRLIRRLVMTIAWNSRLSHGRYCLSSSNPVVTTGFIVEKQRSEDVFWYRFTHESLGILRGWQMGFEPTTFGTTIRRSNQLNYYHHKPGTQVYRGPGSSSTRAERH